MEPAHDDEVDVAALVYLTAGKGPEHDDALDGQLLTEPLAESD
jgi:hypothetical protein